VRVTVRHTYDFGADRERIGDNLVRPDAWDAARTLEGPFGLAPTREAWERSAARPDLRATAADIVAIVRELGARSLCSHGVGTAALEWNLHTVAPELRLVCTDYAPRTVERLQALFPEAEVVLHDLASEDVPSADVHLMHRIDAELADDVWRRVFARLPGPVLFVPNVVLDVRATLRELARRLGRRRLTRAGWFRNEAALRALWADSHTERRVTVGGADAFLLEPF
jgi:hypothetical protein